MKNRRKLQAGFTLIELVMVIVILGILAAVALPRFSNVTNEARIAAARGMEGNIMSAANTVKSTWVARGATGTSVEIEGGVQVTVNGTTGYPTAATAGIKRAVSLGGGWTGSNDDGLFTDGTCTVTYTLTSGVPSTSVSGTNCTP